MPKTRYVDVFENGILVSQEPYVVSDAELAEEQDTSLCEQYLASSAPPITMPQVWHILRCYSKKLGYVVE